MKLEINRKDISDALTHAGAASTTRSGVPLLKTVLLEASDSALRMLGCDGEMWAERTVAANVHQPGKVCVECQVMQQLVGALPDGMVEIETVENQVVLRHGQSDWKLMPYLADDFPPIPENTGTAELRLPMKSVREAVDSVSYAVADDHSRPVLTGVLMRYDGARLTLVATDTHRLAVRHIDREGIGSHVDAIVPEKALKAVKSLPLSDDDELTIQFDEQRLYVDAGSAKVVSMLLMGVYPNWERVVPSEFTRSWTLDREELMSNVNRAMILARDSANRVRFSGNGEMIVISARSDEKGEAKEEVATISKNGDIDIAFNGRYVLDALKAMKGEGICAELTESTRPAVFRPIDEVGEQFCVIMPMALS
ncbi:MAG: DNA polymerase III subunit beta [Chthonomonas sp.]|nr:DNA polymerase III subunit beta [Chthonomonas sp.]